MHKLMILIPTVEHLPEFGELWPEFLHQAERMPGLRKEATSSILQTVYGSLDYSMVHELFFDDYQSLLEGLTSPFGNRAAAVLHKLTRNRAVLLFAEHKEDDIENIRRYQPPDSDETSGQ